MSQVTLETAKSKLLAVQHEIIGMVPADVVVSVFENDTSSLMPCRGEQKKWVGTGQVELLPGLDRTKFLDEVRDSLSGRSGWSATDGTDNDGNRRVELLHEDGTQLLVSFWDGPESLRIGSFSACFEFPEPLHIGDRHTSILAPPEERRSAHTVPPQEVGTGNPVSPLSGSRRSGSQ